MPVSITKDYKQDHTIVIEPDDEYDYIMVDNKDKGAIFMRLKNGFANIITSEGIDENSYSMENFKPMEGDNVYFITERYELTLPSHNKFYADSN